MAVFSGAIRSKVLAMDTGLTVILPYDWPAMNQQEPCKVLYLLHGMGENHTSWTRYTSIERHARAKGLAVVMPEVQRSFYYDMAHGLNYFTYLTVELPELCARMFGISRAREDTYVAGLSMGGYGALKCGLVRPELYCGCASFSGAVDLVRMAAEDHSNPRFTEEFRAILGMDLEVLDQDNLFFLAGQVAKRPPEKQPSIVVTCGTEDFLYKINTGFRDRLSGMALDFHYWEWPGIHDWDFWDESIRRTLDFWLPAASA